MIGTSKDGSFRVHTRADGRIPVALGIHTMREDPVRQGVNVYTVHVEFAFALNQDEANGIGLRLAADKFPLSEGWQPSAIAVRWLDLSEAEEIARAVNNNLVTPPT